MTSINLTLGHHDFLFAIEGFARGSHLRQHVWENIVFPSIRQMDSDFMDYLWFCLRRDVYPLYFDGLNNCGKDDFLHCLAALHRGNRFNVTAHVKGSKKRMYIEAYKYEGLLRPLSHNIGVYGKKEYASFNAYIPDDIIIEAKRVEMPENKYVECGKEDWWYDLSVYD